MSALTYVILTLMAVSTLSLVIYSVCITRIRRKHAKSMQYFDPIKLNVDGEWEEGYYIYQIDSNTHRVNINGTVHDVNFKDIVKACN
jgi:hypothetical protein